MTIYLIKMILCSGLLLGAYTFFLKTEKMYRFNRFYLLFSIIFSLGIPLVQIRTVSGKLPSLNTPILEPLTPTIDPSYPTVYIQAEEKTAYLPAILLIIYGAITLYLLFHFARSIYHVYAKTAGQRSMVHKGTKLVLLNYKTATHTFLNTIFVSKTDYTGDTVEKEILTHELTHVRQKHSLDILFIELLRSVFWFNPFFILYKKAIQLNHEFLADEAVITTYKDIPAYQYLLLDKISQHSSNHLSSPLNFLVAKKRLAMMNQMKNSTRATAKAIAVTILTTGVFILFSEKIIAQVQQDSLTLNPPGVLIVIDSTASGREKKGVSDEVFEEYMRDINKALIRKIANNGTVYLSIDTSGIDINRLRSIYKYMSKEQKQKAPKLIGLIPIPSRPQKKSPTTKALKSWENTAIYGVWLDGKKIPNKNLANYKPSDFSLYDVSKLYGLAKSSVSYYYQVNLETHAYYEKIYKNWSNEQE